MRRLILIAALLACASQRKQHREILAESFEVESYPVDGVTPAEVRRAVEQNRPSAEGGERQDAVTQWVVRYDFDVDPTPFHCTAILPRVELKMWMHLPVLRDVPPQTRAVCAPELEALRAHEDGHVAIDRDTAHKVVELLRTAAPQANCDSLRAEMKSVVERVLEEGRTRNHALDEQQRARASTCMP